MEASGEETQLTGLISNVESILLDMLYAFTSPLEQLRCGADNVELTI